MRRSNYLKSMLFCGATVLAAPAFADEFNIPSGDLETALNIYTTQTRVSLIVSNDAIRGIRTRGARGNLAPEAALLRILSDTGFVMHRHPDGAITIVHDRPDAASTAAVERLEQTTSIRVASSSAAATGIESVVVTSSKIKGDIQTVPIAITALSQEQLTSRQIAGGPDLVKEVPNLTFTKTNFSGYSIQIRGIGTQAISVTTDPAVAVAFNDTPFIRNHFFEQEFYDVGQVEILRGPQGTLYGRNATAGVVNLVSAKPTDQFEATVSGDIGNYRTRRLEGMINIPVVDDRLDIRVAGEWTKRNGYSFNETTGMPIDGRDLWSARVTIGVKPFQNMQAYFVWEHFSENDDRIRSAKQLCKTDEGPGKILGVDFPVGPGVVNTQAWGNYLTQGCKPASLYSPDAFEAPLGYSLPYVTPLQTIGPLATDINPYATTQQNRDLRVIESSLNPIYKAKNDVAEFNVDYNISPTLTLTSQTAYGQDYLYSAEDYNRFGSAPGFFNGAVNGADYIGMASDGTWCDPQLGCSSGLLAEDLSQEHAWQLSQEFRLTSNLSGPLNFSVGGNYLHYETEEKYYVFINAVTLLISKADPDHPWVPNVSDNAFALRRGFQFNDPSRGAEAGIDGGDATYIDPNPISHLNDNGHNYFLSKNPYVLNSYAGFGEAYYDVLKDVKLTAGLRWTEDQKHFVIIPSWLAATGWGYPVAGVADQQWDKLTGRAAVNWTPKLDFTEQTLIYGSYAHGYKAGGANPPGAIFFLGDSAQPTHPLTFKPEFVDSFELGTKNTLFDGALTLNGDVFYYDYKAYQISEIIDRTAINLNFDAHAKGAELEAAWEPFPGLRFNFAGGWEDTAISDGQSAVDLMDRTAGTPGWYIKKPFVTEASNCIFPDYVVVARQGAGPSIGSSSRSFCSFAYIDHLDPVTLLPYQDHPSVMCNTVPDGPGSVCPASEIIPLTPDLVGYPGFDPLSAPNNGTGFSKDLSGNKLPNAPPYTVSFGAQYTMALSEDWAGTLRSDFYWQDDSWWRVFNDLDYDRLHGYTNVNLALILTSAGGWQVMLFDKNVFNTTAITGAFLNSDDSGLTTNVFLTDPRLIGVRVTKNW